MKKFLRIFNISIMLIIIFMILSIIAFTCSGDLASFANCDDPRNWQCSH